MIRSFRFLFLTALCLGASALFAQDKDLTGTPFENMSEVAQMWAEGRMASLDAALDLTTEQESAIWDITLLFAMRIDVTIQQDGAESAIQDHKALLFPHR